MKFVTALLLASTLAATGQAAAQGTGAATLQELNGKVLMNKGDGLVSGKAGTALMDGDRIVTLDKSGAKIVFADGGVVALEENMIFVIGPEGSKALPVASTGAAAAGGMSGTTAALIGAGVLGLGLALGGGGGSSTNDNRPISAQ